VIWRVRALRARWVRLETLRNQGIQAMKLLYTTLLLASVPTALAWSQGQAAQPSTSGGTSSLTTIGPFVRLQPGSPGAAQAGNSHITGTAMAGEFVANSASGTGLIASGAASGVVGYSSNPSAVGTYGENFPGYGVVGVSNNIAVWGQNLGTGIGVYGTNLSLTNAGVWGEGYYGVLGVGDQGITGFGTYGLVSFGTAHVSGDLVVTGSKTGYVVDLIRNGDSVPLAPGELVEIVGSEPAVLGDIPVAIVQRASAANARAVLGPISNALALGPELAMPPEHLAPLHSDASRLATARPASAPGVLRVEGAILPGGYGNVVTLGAFRALKVDARYGAIRAGDLLVASPEPGFAMADPDPRVGTVIGKALASWSAGQGEIPVMVGVR
jgi:hypothetical protein